MPNYDFYSHFYVWLTSNMINADKYAYFMINVDKYTDSMFNTENSNIVQVNLNIIFIPYLIIMKK